MHFDVGHVQYEVCHGFVVVYIDLIMFELILKLGRSNENSRVSFID